jgi:signal transduction histidine kinase
MEGNREQTGGLRRSRLTGRLRVPRLLEFRGDERALATHAVAVVFLVGAALTAITVAMPPSAEGSDLLILGIGALSAIGGIVLLKLRRVSEPALGLAVALGTAMITVVTLEAGPGRGTDDNEVLYLWVLVYSFWFLRLPHALGQLALIGVADALLLAESASFGAATTTRWLVAMVTFLVVGLLLSWVRRRLERQREERTRLAVMDERMRIARELHDSTGHGVNVISIQAAAALSAMQRDPEAARDALEGIKRTSRETSEDMRRLLNVLREREATAEELGRSSLTNLDQLVRESRTVGVPVDVAVRGDPLDLPSALDQAAYRVLEEAVTNVGKYAGRGARAQVTVAYWPEVLELEVVDDGGEDATSGERGDPDELIGIRERVGAFGGEFKTMPRLDGGHRVSARFPLRRQTDRWD